MIDAIPLSEPTMLQTPAGFIPLMRPETHTDLLTFVFHDRRMLVRAADLALPDAAALALLDIPPQRLRPVGLWGTRYAQTVWTDTDAAPEGYEWRGMRSLFGALDDDFLGVAGRAAQIAEWARTHKFCGACGHTTVQAEGERCMTCPNCAHLAYPRISPAMMVLIRKGDQVLLAMHAVSPAKRYTPLAGFLEAGESIEEAVHREVMEEVGLRVHNLQYFSSQSWPFPHSLMIAFTADYLDGEIRIDPNEIADARWFGPDDVWPEKVAHVSVSAMLVDAHRPPGR